MEDDSSQFVEGALIWTLSSNRGWEEAECVCAGGSNDTRIVSSIRLTGQFWDERQLQVGSRAEADLTEDYCLLFSQIVLNRRSLITLDKQLISWLECPVSIAASLGTEHQDVILRLGPNEQIISSLAKPVCEITVIDGSRSSATTRWVTDQSCIRIMQSQLSAWLATNNSG